MKFGMRMPSPKRSIKAATTGRVKRTVRRATTPLYGKSGMGYIKDPKKAVYNKAYSSTSIGVREALSSKDRATKSDGGVYGSSLQESEPIPKFAAGIVVFFVMAIATLPLFLVSMLINAYITGMTGLVVPMWIVLELLCGGVVVLKMYKGSKQ